MEGFRIWIVCIVAAVLYGEVHDQVTARVCVEYFTIGHAPIFNTTSPTLLALGWGLIATWWVGASLGIIVAAAARIGSWPKLNAREITVPVAWLMAFAALLALIMGVAGYESARNGAAELTGYLAAAVPPDKHAVFIADWWAHTASYDAGFVGSIVVCAWILFQRRRRATANPSNDASTRSSAH